MRRRRALTIALFAVLALTVAACGTTNPTAQLKEGGTISIDNESGTRWTCGFNPFNANVNSFAFGPVYEPLVYNNLLNGKTTPMLASSYKWSSDSKTLTFTTRSGVKWTDGQPFTAADVVYTFKLMKTNSALDLQSVWTVLSDVTQQGSDQVVMTFTTPAVPYFYYIAGQVAIVPEHIWSQIKDPVGENMPKPIGTGPFTVGDCTPQNIPYLRNPNYWQAGLQHIAKVNYPASLDNNPAKAQSLLQQAGFTKGSDGIFKDSAGKRLSFTVISISGYTDWTASLQVVRDNLKEIGVEIKEQDLSHDDYFNKLFLGQFQMGYGSLSNSPGPNPYYELRNTLYSQTSAAIGQTASGDYGRWTDPATDRLIEQFGATTSTAEQHNIMKQIQGIMLEQVPVIPVTESVAWYQYSTKGFGGWPTRDDPYAAPAPWNIPDWEQVLLRVHAT